MLRKVDAFHSSDNDELVQMPSRQLIVVTGQCPRCSAAQSADFSMS
jgi:hypothetical protein